MKKRSITIFLLTIVLIGSLFFQDLEHLSVQADTPEFEDVEVHDPAIIKSDDEYYVFGSHLASAKTEDFIQWEQVSLEVSEHNPLFDNVYEELSETFEWAETDTLWAADVTKVGEQYFMYYNGSKGTEPRAAMGLAVADDIEGPYEDHGIFLKSGMWDEESPDGEIYDATIHPHAIDPHAFFDEDGDFWLLYGSYSGGIFIMELDPETGIPFEGQGYGEHLIGGNHARIEGPYMQYDEESGYYYLHLTYGGLDSDGGYNMRVMRSENPDGPFEDAAGHDMRDVKGEEGSFFDDESIAPYGVKLMGNFMIDRTPGEIGEDHGYISPGHNSVYTDENGESFMFFHTRFPNRGEAHEVRVHRLITNQEGWPVLAPLRYAGEEIIAVDAQEVAGYYHFLDHGLEFSEDINEAGAIELTSDGDITGDTNGTWEMTGENDIELTIDDTTYYGVVLEQWNPMTESFDYTFSAIGDDNRTVAGIETIEATPESAVEATIDQLTIDDEVTGDLDLITESSGGTEIEWSSSDESIISPDGTVTRPDMDDEDENVTLTATVSNESVEDTVSFDVTVLKESVGGIHAYYSFNETLEDETQTHEAGSIIGEMIGEDGGKENYRAGQFNHAFYFDGETGIELPEELLTSNHYAVSFWLQPESMTEFTTTFFAGNEDNWLSFTPMGHDGSSMLWSLEDGNWFDGYLDEDLSEDQWHHIVINNDQGDLTLYLDGDAVEFEDFHSTMSEDSVHFALGVNFWDQPYHGLLDELVIYQDYSLTEDDVVHLQNGDIPDLDQSAEAIDVDSAEDDHDSLVIIYSVLTLVGLGILTWLIIKFIKNKQA